MAMRALILPLVLTLAGGAGGVAAGLALRTPPEPAPDAAPEKPEKPREYVRLTNQFIVPLVEDGRIGSLVILALSVEVDEGQSEAVYAREPKLRDALLQVLFDHANSGGFAGTYTDGTALEPLRRALREAGSQVMGPVLSDILIVDIVRQDS